MLAKNKVAIATTKPAAVEIKASPIPPVTPAAWDDAMFPSFKEDKEVIKPKTVPNKPNKGATPMTVSRELLNRFRPGISA